LAPSIEGFAFSDRFVYDAPRRVFEVAARDEETLQEDMMTETQIRLVALITLVAFGQFACYNTYFISKDELEKLESGVETKEVVEVSADCKGATASRSGELDGTRWAQAANGATKNKKATDAASSNSESTSKPGCKKVPVSTSNAINVVSNGGEEFRVTPFNFRMSKKQLVSPEYDLLLSLDRVEGAQVRQFSTWKTIGTIVGVSAATIGMFVGISVLAPESDNF
jgi:hypothetical protein